MKKGQLSAEMLIVLVLILGLVFIIYSQLSSNVKTLSQKTSERTEKIANMTDVSPSDIFCTKDSDCEKVNSEWKCDTTTSTCTA
ncbi:MAG: hypothetical protein ACK4J0_00085 [Candidatus Anstonellaceae archaeon]